MQFHVVHVAKGDRVLVPRLQRFSPWLCEREVMRFALIAADQAGLGTYVFKVAFRPDAWWSFG